MKTIPTLTIPYGNPEEITRIQAAIKLRLERSRPAGKVHKFPSCGYILATQNCAVNCPKPPKPIPPPPPFSLARRLTHGYVNGWKDLEKWHDLGTGRVIRRKDAREDSDGGYSQLVIIEVEPDAGKYRPRNIMRAIADTMQHGCRCEHDCCGHIQTHVARTRRLRDGRYAAIISGYPNI